MAKKLIFSKKIEEKFNDIYFATLEKTQNSTEYNTNYNKIDLYKKILKNNYNVPKDKIEEFVSLIHEQLELEYENAIKNFMNSINENTKKE